MFLRSGVCLFFLILLRVDSKIVLSKEPIVFVFVCYEVERVIRVESSLDVQPVVIQCLLFDALTLTCYFLMSNVDVKCCLFESQGFNPTLNCVIIVAKTDQALSKHHSYGLIHSAATSTLESPING